MDGGARGSGEHASRWCDIALPRCAHAHDGGGGRSIAAAYGRACAAKAGGGKQTMSRKTIILPKGRRARSGAPWIFSNEIRMDQAAKAIAPGAIVNVRGEDGRDFGTGYFNPKSLIAVRLLA